MASQPRGHRPAGLPCGRWPTGPVTEDDDYVDLVWHECELRDGSSFTYVVTDDAGRYLGCAYLYPVGDRTPLTADLLRHDVDVSWWITPDAYRQGFYAKVYGAPRQRTTTAFPFTNPYYSNAEIPSDRSQPAASRTGSDSQGLRWTET